jgi:hypothetical protein
MALGRLAPEPRVAVPHHSRRSTPEHVTPIRTGSMECERIERRTTRQRGLLHPHRAA